MEAHEVAADGELPMLVFVPDSLCLSVSALESDLFLRLNQPRRWFRRRTDPEVVRVWGRIREELGEIQVLLGRTRTAQSGAVRELEDLLATQPAKEDQWTLDFARRFDHSLRQIVPLFADSAYLRAAFRTNKTKKRFVEAFGEDRFTAVERTLEQDDLTLEELAQIAVELRMAWVHRANERRKSHAKIDVRASLLRRMLILLLVVVSSSVVVLAVAKETTAWFVLVAVCTGALGSILSGFFNLRDDVHRLTDLRAFRTALFVQPFVGAAAGLFAFLLVRADVLHVPSADPGPAFTPYGLYGFLAGFSEPFLIGAARRLASEPDAAALDGSKRRGRDKSGR
jgi:hypothetical protein